ncbi:hypothetical protein Sps_01675 [Shewanella psychrophila]|uniref:Uncharacterized protein n=1 Tax=Shewanella psychrophila TaxID=225848 RepID=A0A1S6HMU6_9GAMM|nr:putative DNA-binding domain-containing protein [Shewanella psychrophila]AQS36840.1 hypothetical protein Sps_01675 [Shewanella psychrophila]
MSFEAIQQSFIDYIKEPSRPLPEGTEARRMKIYRDLFFNNINGFVTSAFPVLKSLYSEEDWLALVQEFFVTHDCQTPIFIEIAQEFVVFLQSEYLLKESDPVFIIELAHYEYMELVVAVAKDNPLHQNIQEPIEQVSLCLSDTAKVLQYSFDVQRISEDYRPVAPAETPQLFCLYRDVQDEVIFLQLNPLTAQVLGYLSQYESVSFYHLLSWLKQTYPQMEEEILAHGCGDMLVELAVKGVVKQHPS